MSPKDYQELQGKAFDFIAKNGGEHLFVDVAPQRQAQMLSEVMRVLNRNRPIEIERAKFILNSEPFEKIVEFFCDESLLNRDLEENGQRFEKAERAARWNQQKNEATVWLEDARDAAKDYLKHRLLLEPTMVAAAWVAGVSHQTVEHAAAGVALTSALALVVDRYEAHLYPIALKRLHEQKDADKLPRLECLRQNPSSEGVSPEDPIALRRKQGLLSRDIITYLIDASSPSLRHALVSVSEKTLLSFSDNMVALGQHRRPPVAFDRPLNSVDRAFVRNNGLRIAQKLGIPRAMSSPSLLSRTLDHAEGVLDAKETLVHSITNVPKLLRRGEIAKRLDEHLVKPEPGKARLGRKTAP